VRKSFNEQQLCEGEAAFGVLGSSFCDGSDIRPFFIWFSHQWLNGKPCFLSDSPESLCKSSKKVEHVLKARETCFDQLAIDGIDHLDGPTAADVLGVCQKTVFLA